MRPVTGGVATGIRTPRLARRRSLVKACHQRGMEVILDVVFNHTAEGSEQGLTLSFR